MNHLRTICVIILSLLFFLPSGGQDYYSIELIYDKNSDIQPEKYLSRDKLKDHKAVYAELTAMLGRLYDKGYLAASVDSVTFDSLEVRAVITTGNRYLYAALDRGNADPMVLSEAGFRESDFAGRPVSPPALKNMMAAIIRSCENNGYPFARIRLDSLRIKGDTLAASLNLDKGYYISFDSIIIKGNSKIKPSYLANYFEIKKGKPYDERKLTQIPSGIDEIAFVSEIRPFELAFTEETASIYLYLDKNRASRFDGFLGIAPNNESTGNVLVTGELNLYLISIFQRGEELSLNWRKPGPLSQDLRINIGYPFLFSTPFGIDYNFRLFKQDTSYLTLNNRIGLRYIFAANHHLTAYFNAFSSSLLSNSGMDDLAALPTYADVRTSSYGAEYFYSNLDYRYNPRKGIAFTANLSYGKKIISENPDINPALYDSITLENNIFQGLLSFDNFIPVFRKMTILTGLKGGFLSNENLFSNELYRIGGLRTLRGFDEESLFASSYALLNLEFRYLLERNSYFSLFWNGAWYENDSYNTYLKDTPWGFGAGLSFDTQAGIFSLFYAVGSQASRPLELKNAKIHFGYSSVF